MQAPSSSPARPRLWPTPSGLLLLAAQAWLAWLAASGVRDAWRAPIGVVAALRTPADERLDDWLGPFGIELRELVERETPPDARIFVVVDEFAPGAHQLYARLLITCFPRVVLSLLADRLGEVVPGDFVLLLQPELSAGLAGRGRLVAGHKRYELWAIER